MPPQPNGWAGSPLRSGLVSKAQARDEQSRRIRWALVICVTVLIGVQIGVPILYDAGVVGWRTGLLVALAVLFTTLFGLGWWVARAGGSATRETMQRRTRDGSS